MMAASYIIPVNEHTNSSIDSTRDPRGFRAFYGNVALQGAQTSRRHAEGVCMHLVLLFAVNINSLCCEYRVETLSKTENLLTNSRSWMTHPLIVIIVIFSFLKSHWTRLGRCDTSDTTIYLSLILSFY